ncbi:hypothetical protein A1OE_1135 [Candidatus Endolissoclinum faulkneri L2]|uniref:Uncharacterized protein n=1 Tax=Candidatus Endolissoclinum faulkneri L2 TaxID=1193729 RepID=K7Z5I6_9PROT|nr:hypothetical protein A1OE_1135 [Candidatus Endolissoclinum faulkneri L2]
MYFFRLLLSFYRLKNLFLYHKIKSFYYNFHPINMATGKLTILIIFIKKNKLISSTVKNFAK